MVGLLIAKDSSEVADHWNAQFSADHTTTRTAPGNMKLATAGTIVINQIPPHMEPVRELKLQDFDLAQSHDFWGLTDD